MENYRIKVWATALYLKNENSSTRAARFIAENEWSKIFVHGLNEENENNVFISKYEKYEKYEIPFNLIEQIEDIIEETIDDKQEEEKTHTNANFAVDFIEKNKMIILWIIIWIFISLFLSQVNLKESKANIFENEMTQTWTWYLDSLTQRNISLDNKENFEIEKQKRLREEKRKAIQQFDSEINASIEAVKQIKKEKDEILKQKIDFAQ